jgi:hypothetical protein
MPNSHSKEHGFGVLLQIEPGGQGGPASERRTRTVVDRLRGRESDLFVAAPQPFFQQASDFTRRITVSSII